MKDERIPHNRGSQPWDKSSEQVRVERERIWREAERTADEACGKLPNWEDVGARIESLYEEMGPFICLVLELSPREAEYIFAEKFKLAGMDANVDYSGILKTFRLVHQLAEMKRKGKLDELQSPSVAKMLARKTLANPDGEMDLEAIVDEVDAGGGRSPLSGSELLAAKKTLPKKRSRASGKSKAGTKRAKGKRNKFKI